MIRVLNHYQGNRRTVHAASGVVAKRGAHRVVWAATACGAVEGEGISEPFFGLAAHVTCEGCRAALEDRRAA